MHACDTCMFCHYRNLRIAAFAAREGGAPEAAPASESAQQPSPPAAAQRMPPPRADLANRETLVS
jgi:hypothetical protein